MAPNFDHQKKVFICGTGRSGTSLLHDMVSAHPQIHGLRGETKFIVEGDGLAALIPALTDRYSITAADLALLRFMALMGLDVPATQFQDGPDFARDLAARIGERFFVPALQSYVEALIDFNVTTAADPTGSPYPKHFEDPGTLIALTRAFIDAMFGAACDAAGKSVWCEKTPSSLVAIDLLWQLFPEARMLHIKRDPRGVLHSLMQQAWAPQDLRQATALLRHIYIRWLRLKPRLALPDPRYLEIKLEDLCADPDLVMGQVARTIGIPPEFRVTGTRIAMVDRWKVEMPGPHRAYAEAELEDIFDLMGYSI